MATLYVAIGLPGSGKSTWGNSRENLKVHSSDLIRKELYGSESIQGDNNIIFDILNKRIEADLIAGMDCYYDATSLTANIRRDIVRKFRPHADKIIALYFNEPIGVCKERNSKRERKVPTEVINRMASRLTPPALNEGFDEIFYKNPLDLIDNL
jgi:predicted kinase